MTLVEQIEKDRLNARKNRDTFTSAKLTTLLGDILRIGKDDGNRITTTEEALRVIKKAVKNINDTLDLNISDSDRSELRKELNILNNYIPKQTTGVELSNHIVDIIQSIKESGNNPNIGSVMKTLKSSIENFDGKEASTIIKGLI